MEQSLYSELESDLDSKLNLALQCQEMGDLQQAETICLELLELHPDHPQLLLTLGTIAHQVGSLEIAHFFLQKGIQFDRGNPLFHYKLSLVYQDLKKWKQSIRYCQQSIILDPKCGLYYLTLASVLASQECWLESIVYFNFAANLLTPDSPEYIKIQGGINQALGELGCDLAQALERSEQLAELEYKKGLSSFRDQIHYKAALEYFWQAFLFKPNYAHPCFRIGNIIDSQNRLSESIVFYKVALYWDPYLVEASYALGIVFLRLAYWKEAEKVFQEALALAPTDVNLVSGYAQLLMFTGNTEKARSLIDPLIASGSCHKRVVSVFASICDEQGEQERSQAIDYLRACLDQNTSYDYHGCFFELAQLLDKQQQYSKAFNAAHQGNQLLIERFGHFSVDKWHNFVSNLKTVFDQDRFNIDRRLSNDSSFLVFIVGMPRSGTSLTEQILSCHPDIHAAGELNDLPQLAVSLTHYADPQIPYPQCINHITPLQLAQVAEHYLKKIRFLDANAKKITDKMPINFIHLGIIALLFPQARIIHCNRHPLDTCISCYFMNFAAVHSFSFDLEDLGHYYVEYRRLMQHWTKILPIPIFNLTYEHLVRDPESQIREVLRFCDLTWNDACLNFHKSKRSVATASNRQVRQPLYTRSIGRYKHYQEHLQPLKEILKRYHCLDDTELD